MTTRTTAGSEQIVLREPRALAGDPTSSILTVSDVGHENPASRVARHSPQLTTNQESKEHGIRTRRTTAFGTLRLTDPAAKSDTKYKGNGRFAIHLNNDEDEVQSAKTAPIVKGVPQIGGGIEFQEDDFESDSGCYDSCPSYVHFLT